MNGRITLAIEYDISLTIAMACAYQPFLYHFMLGTFLPLSLSLSLAFAYIKHFTIEKCTGRFLFMWKRFEAASLFNDSIYIIFLFNFRPASDKTDSLLHSQTIFFRSTAVVLALCRCIIWFWTANLLCLFYIVPKSIVHDKNDHPNELLKFYDQHTI